MAKRRAIPQSIRFEVFKRDSFKCQYCGRSAPDVLLHIDHIHPVAKGGDNDISNLITACIDCNIGKGCKVISDDSIIKKQKKQLDELSARREQLEAMLEWRQELIEYKKQNSDIIVRAYETIVQHEAYDTEKKSINNLISTFGLEEVYDSLDILATKTPWRGQEIKYLAGICWTRRRQQNIGKD